MPGRNTCVKMRTMNRKRGIALITTLMLAGLLMLLLGAFMQVNRSQFALLGGSEDRENALRTIKSVHEYCVWQLERDETWAEAPFGGDTPDNGFLTTYMTATGIGGEDPPVVRGTIPSLNSEFEVTVENNLADPQQEVILRISATVGTLTRNVETRMRPVALYDSGVAAGGGVQVSASEWTVGSRDPYRNIIRASGDIDAPDHANVNFVSRQNAAGEDGADQGIFWANNDISFYVGASRQSVTDPLVMEDAVADTGGRFFPNSGVSHSIHDLQARDVAVPAATSSIQDGEYRFTNETCTFQKWVKVGSNPSRYDWRTRTSVVPVMQRYSSGGALTDYWFTQASLAGTTQNPSFSTSGTPHEETSTTFDLDVGQLVEVTLDTPGPSKPAFNVQADGKIDVPGNFMVTSTGDEPVLSFSGAGADSQIEVDGDVTFEGELSGKGIVVSRNGTVTLDVSNVATSGNELGVSLFAANDIEINATGGGSLSFNGLLFARNSVTVNGVNDDFIVDGALVAKNGDITINTGGKVDLTYNPDYLKVLLEKLPDDRTKLETVVWKE
jgi:hypothetical protein